MDHIRAVAVVVVLFLMIAGGARAFFARGAETNSGKPWIVQRDEGEKRIRRPRGVPLPSAEMVIKVDRQNGGSQHLVMISEAIPPGQVIPRHKHFDQDEILVIQSSTAHASVGGLERDVSAGAVIYIPADTWVTVKNTGRESLSLLAIFSSPGFDDYLRCTSVPEGQAPAPMNEGEWKECQHQGHTEFVGNAAPASPK